MAEPLLKVEVADRIATLTMSRPDKRNAMNDALMAEIDHFFSHPPEDVKAAILTGAAGPFCSGRDLSEHIDLTAEQNMFRSRGWHAVMDRIQFGRIPVVSALSGAVIGGGASVRVGRILGADRMVEIMLTGRKIRADEGVALGLAHYLVGEGEALDRARELAGKIARNAPLSNYVMMHAIGRIEDMAKADGLFTESLCAALVQTTPDAKEGLAAFLEKRPPVFR